MIHIRYRLSSVREKISFLKSSFSIFLLLLTSCTTQTELNEDQKACMLIAQSYKENSHKKPIATSDDLKDKKADFKRYLDVERCARNVLTKGEWTNAYNTLQGIMDTIYDDYISQEKELFKNRTGGKSLCGNFITIFMPWPGRSVNPKNCIYYEGFNNLVAVQSIENGILARSLRPHFVEPQVYVHIQKGQQDQDIVDETVMENGYFEYIGNYSYYTIFGARRTVHSFKRVDPAIFKDIYFYNNIN